MIENRLEGHETVLVDGIRSGTEVDVFEEAFGDAFTLVSIEAPFELRAERIDERGRDASEADGGEGLAARDERERGFGMDDAMERADVVVENTDSLEAFHDRIRSIVRGTDDEKRAEAEADP
jgi:dephospho-CoA kinase